MNKLILLVAIAACASSCKPKPVYESTRNIDPTNWSYDDVLNFEFQISDTTSLNDMVLNLWHDDTFSFENLYLKITTEFPDKDSRTTQLSIPTASSEGLWLGDCSRGTCKTNYTIAEKFRFPQIGNYKIQIEQFSRSPELSGIQKLGIQIFIITETAS